MHFAKPVRILVLAALTMAGGSAAAMDPAPVEAGWKEVELNFFYNGRTSFYTCDSIERKITRILVEIGARKSPDVRATGCFSNFSPERFQTVRIRMAVPVPISPGEGLSPEEKSRRELVAKVRGEAPGEGIDERFPAAWERVEFSRKSRFVEDGDCELLEQLELQVFRKLDIRVIDDGGWCVPGQVRFGQLNMEIETLKALPDVDEAAPATPPP